MTNLTHAERIEQLVTQFGITADQANQAIEALEQNGEIDDEVYEVMFSHYCDSGEMPYGTAKARDGDPYEWVYGRVADELGLEA